MKAIKCISTGFLSGILLMSNMGVHAESKDTSLKASLSAQNMIIDQAVDSTSNIILSIVNDIEVNQPDVREYINDNSYVETTKPVVTYVEQPVENIITYEEFMQMVEELQTEPIQETIDQTTAAQADYDAALAAYNEALAQYDAAQKALTAASVPVTVIEQAEDEEGNVIEVEKEIIPDTSYEQAALESASLNLINAEASLNTASQALESTQQISYVSIAEEDLSDEIIESAPIEEIEASEINQEVVEKTETTKADKVTGTTSDGLTYESTDGSTAKITGYTQTITNLIIPAAVDGYTVTTIGSYAFDGCTQIKTISLPSSLTNIQEAAFRGCTGLTSIVLPEGLTTAKGYSGRGVFANCTNLTSVTIPTTLATAEYIFNGCTKLTRIVLPEGMTNVPGSMFNGNTCIREVVLPSTLQTISSYAFDGCTQISSISFPAGLTNIQEAAFRGCTGLTGIVLPEGLTTAKGYSGRGVFANCTNLTSVTIPTTLATAEHIFNGCTKLTRIVLPEGMTNVPGSMFNGNTCIREVVLPSTIKTISSYAFDGCTQISSISFPAGLMNMQEAAFRGCTGLTVIVLPEGFTTAKGYSGRGVFANCTNLTSVTIPTTLGTAEYIFNGCTKLIRVVLPEGMTNVPGSMFNGNTCIREVVLPSTIETISSYAFYGCTEIHTISFPTGLTKIQEAAFRGCTGLTSIVLPESLTTINGYSGRGAFENCSNLRNVFCPLSLSTIFVGSFSNINNLNIISEYSCYATMYAIQNNISFKVLKGHKDDDSCVLDRDVSSLSVYYDGMSVNGYIPVTVSYRIKDTWKDKVSNLKLDICLPANVEISEDSLKLSDTLLKNYTLNNRSLIVPVSKQEDQLKFLMKVKEQGRLLGYFSLSMKKDSTSTYEVIDLINEETRNFFTINAPDITGNKTLTVDGLAPASSDVSIYINDELYAAVKASKAGMWQANLQIAPQRDYQVFLLKALINDTDTVEKKIIYAVNNPVITTMTMKYYEHNTCHVVNLLDESTVKPSVLFLPGSRFDFELSFDKPESIEKVYVTSVRNNVKKYLEAVYDQSSGTFKTNGYFDPNNKGYVPGKLSYEFIPKHEVYPIDPDMDFNIVKTTDVFDDKFTLITDSDKEFAADLDLSQFIEDGSKSNLEYRYRLFDSPDDPDLIGSDFYELYTEDSQRIIKYSLPGKDGRNYLVTLDYTNPTTYLMLIHDLTDNKLVGLTLDYLSDDGMNLGWQQASDVVSTVGDVTGLLYEYLQIADEAEDLRNEVMSSTNYSTQEERDHALQMVDELEFDKKAFLLITVAAPLVLGLGVATCAMTGPAVILAGMIAIITMMAPLFWNYRTAQIKGEDYSVRFMIDPSGYVYDIDTKERLENVTTTAYWIEYDESEGFWDNKPADTEYGILWDASEYNIQNPMLSNIDGKYGWDVPEGWWRVKYEKEGYTTTWSDWMPVPPIQTEVNIGMKSKSMPFTDVPGDAWYYSVAKECYETGLINGTSATTFSPMQEMTRAMVVTILWRMEGQPKVDFNNKFSDVSSKQWYATSVSWAEQAGVVHGYGDGTFKPDAAVTREQVAVMLANYAQYKGVYVPGTKKLNTYPDGSQVSAWAQAGMKWALTEGIITGNGAGYLNPKKSATRAEGAAMLLRMKNWL